MQKIHVLMLSAFVFGLSLFTVSSTLAQEATPDDAGQVAVSAIAPILDAEGNQLGLVGVGDAYGEMGLMVIVQGLAEGEHGIHLHETGNCDPEGETTFASAGGHFNPGGMTHPDHAGDLGNLTADVNGNVIFLPGLGTMTFDDLADADGTALVIHADPDDLVTDPSGNSGARIACAVIAAAA